MRMFCITLWCLCSVAAVRNLTLVIQATVGYQATLQQYSDTFQTGVGGALEGYDVSVSIVNDTNALSNMLVDGSADLFVAGPTGTVCNQLVVGADSIASRVDISTGVPVDSLAGSLIVLSNRSDINTFQDVRGKVVGAVGLTTLASPLAQWAELSGQGINLLRESKAVFFSGSLPQVTADVLTGVVDVGCVSSTTPLDPVFRILEPRINPGFPLPSSTRLYPQALLSAMPSLDRELRINLTSALFNITPDSDIALNAGGYWATPQNILNVTALQFDLGLFTPSNTACVNVTDFLSVLQCGDGYEKARDITSSISCSERANVSCPAGYLCVCSPCMRIPKKKPSVQLAVILSACIAGVLLIALCAAGGWGYHYMLRQRRMGELVTINQAAKALLGAAEIREMIGRGSYARVYRGVWNGADVAIKISDAVERQLDKSVQEAGISETLVHPNIVVTFMHATRIVDKNKRELYLQGDSRAKSGGKTTGDRRSIGAKAPSGTSPLSRSKGTPQKTLSGSLEEEEAMRALVETWIVMKYCDRGSLRHAVAHGAFRKRDKPDHVAILRTVREIANGVKYLHGRHVLHGDLNTNNVLLTTSTADSRGFTACVADFGLSRMFKEWSEAGQTTLTYGTVTHMPPELLHDGQLRSEGDIYAFGIMLWELYTSECAYEGKTHGQVIQEVTVRNTRPTFPNGAWVEYVSLATRCWDRSYELRPSWREILSSLDSMLCHAK